MTMSPGRDVASPTVCLPVSTEGHAIQHAPSTHLHGAQHPIRPNQVDSQQRDQ